MEYELENPLTALQEHQQDTIPVLFDNESDHMPCENFIKALKTCDFDNSLRRQAISMILQTQFSGNLFDPLVSYLAINYFDRFISRNETQQDKPWFFRLITVSCISLAAKVKKTEFSLSNLQRKEGLIFDSQTIQRTELLILGTLNWRMHSITPFSFFHFLISFFKLKDSPLLQALRARATEIILKSLHEINLLGFKPSIIAASALLSASHELFPIQFPCFSKAISSCAYINNEKLMECCNMIQDIVMDSYDSVIINRVTNSDTPVNVLGHQAIEYFLSLGDSNSTYQKSGPDMKRRKICDFCNNNNKDKDKDTLQQLCHPSLNTADTVPK